MASQELILPQKVVCDEKTLTDRYGRFIAEPFERGYGHTIGNSFRRVLLSSLEGAAVVAVRVKGAMHEYASLKGVKEDVLNIILNMKKLRIRLFAETGTTLRLHVRTPGPVLAKHIETNAGVTILNPDLVIANLDAGGELEMELEVASGRGYVLAEQNKKDGQPVGTIPIDSLFSPVVKVYYDVGNARVGQITDYDKLILDIWTDGSLTPKEVLTKATTILNNAISVFTSNGSEPVVAETEPVVENVPATLDNKMQEVLDQPIEMIELSVRAANCLRVARIKTIKELVRKTEQELLDYKNFGQKSLDEIKEKLVEMGLSLGMTI